MRNIAPIVASALVLAVLAGCASHAPAPVIERAPPPSQESKAAVPAAPAAAEAGFYVVKKGDTLYSIALEHGRDHKEVAAWNGIENPNSIKVGQRLRVTPPGGEGAPVVVVKPVAGPAPVEIKPAPGKVAAPPPAEGVRREPRGGKVAYSEQALASARASAGAPPVAEVKPAETPPAAAPAVAEKPPVPAAAAPAPGALEWSWPSAGKVISRFGEGPNKGLDLDAKMGDPINAAADGRVTYVGTLRGYGNFLVLRHTGALISVYAHTSRILVKEEQQIKRGQKIAEAGNSDADRPKLHFQVRLQGQPVDPLKYLPPR